MSKKLIKLYLLYQRYTLSSALIISTLLIVITEKMKTNVFNYRFSLIHFSFGTPIVIFLYGMPLMASTGFPSLYNNLTLPEKSLDGWRGLGHLKRCSPPNVHNLRTPCDIFGSNSAGQIKFKMFAETTRINLLSVKLVPSTHVFENSSESLAALASFIL